MISVWIQKFVFTFVNVAETPCMCAVELTTLGNPAVLGHILQWGSFYGKSQHGVNTKSLTSA